MSDDTKSYLIPNNKFGYFLICPISNLDSNKLELSESYVSAEFEKILPPMSGNELSSKKHAKDIIEYAKGFLLDSKLYIYSLGNKTFVFYKNGLIKNDYDAHQLVDEIILSPTKYPSNSLFTRKFK